MRGFPGVTATGHAPCDKGGRYIQQLIKHWSHKFDTSYSEGRGEVHFSDSNHAGFDAREGGIDITLTTADPEENMRMRNVIEQHLDRFAFREAPLTYRWNAG